MKLKSFNTKNCGQRMGGLFISMNKTGLINISSQVCALIGIKENTKLEIFQDEEEPADWYIGISKSADAFDVRHRQKNGTFCIQSSFLCNHIRESIKLEQVSVKFLVSKESQKNNGLVLFPIITKSAKTTQRVKE